MFSTIAYRYITGQSYRPTHDGGVVIYERDSICSKNEQWFSLMAVRVHIELSVGRPAALIRPTLADCMFAVVASCVCETSASTRDHLMSRAENIIV